MKNFLPYGAALLLLSLAACGKIEKPSISAKDSSLATKTTDVKLSAFAEAWGKDLVSGCKAHQGYMNSDGNQCTVVEVLKTLDGTEKPGTSVDVGDIGDGVGILATGYSSGALEVTLDNKNISAVPSPNNQPIMPSRGGHLAVLVNPGVFYDNVRIYSYTCVGVSLTPMRCLF